MRQKSLNPLIIPRPLKTFTEESVDSELVLYHAPTAQVVSLDQNATLIWKLCDGNRSIAEIVELIKGAYPESSNIEQDVHSAIYEFADFGALSLK